MSRNKISNHINFGRRFLTLDKYMTGNFFPLIVWTFILALIGFVILYAIVAIIGWWSGDVAFLDVWTPGYAFIQMTNPGRQFFLSSWEWVGVILFNLFGIFIIEGVALTILVNWVSNRKGNYEKGSARYNYIFKRKFAVILGGHKAATSLAKDLIEKSDNEFVVIQTKRNPEILRKELRAEINNPDKTDRIIIYAGDRTSPHELRELHLDKAREIFLIGEPSQIDGSSHDAISMQTWAIMNEIYSIPVREKKIPCHVMFEYQSTFSAFQFTDLKVEESKIFNFIPFSLYENWAQQVLLCKPSKQEETPYYMPLDGKGISFDCPDRVHLIICGMSKMGVALGIEAAHLSHYPNFINTELGHPRTLITFIDRNAKREMLYFMGRFKDLFKLARWRYIKAPSDILLKDSEDWEIYDSQSAMRINNNSRYRWNDPMKDKDLNSPYYGGFLGEDLIDIDFEFIEGDISLPSIQKYIKDACEDKPVQYIPNHNHSATSGGSLTTIAICFPEAIEAMSTALYFDPAVYDNVQQIWVQQTVSGAMVDSVSKGFTGNMNSRFKVLRPFGMLEKCDYFSRSNSILPKLVVMAYNSVWKNTNLYAQFKTTDPKSLQTLADRAWEEISTSGGKSAIAKKWSNIYCANSFPTKLRSVALEETDLSLLDDEEKVKQLSIIEHNRWIMEQLLIGQRPVDNTIHLKFPIEDPEIRDSLKSRNIHPDIISYEKLGNTKGYDTGIVNIIPFAVKIEKSLASNKN